MHVRRRADARRSAFLGTRVDEPVLLVQIEPGVRVDVGAVVRDSIVMFDTVIRSGAVVDRAILDKEVVVGQGAIVGNGPYDDRPNRQEPTRLNTGITVVGKRAVVPRGTRLGRNVKVAEDVRMSVWAKQVIKRGGSVEMKAGVRHAHDHGRAVGVGPVSEAAAQGRS